MSGNCKNELLKDKLSEVSEERKRYFGDCKKDFKKSFCSNPVVEGFVNFAFSEKFSIRDKFFK